MIVLLNGHQAERARSSEGCIVLECGCAYTDREYVQMCAEHAEEWRYLHEEAQLAHSVKP